MILFSIARINLTKLRITGHLGIKFTVARQDRVPEPKLYIGCDTSGRLVERTRILIVLKLNLPHVALDSALSLITRCNKDISRVQTRKSSTVARPL